MGPEQLWKGVTAWFSDPPEGTPGVNAPVERPPTARDLPTLPTGQRLGDELTAMTSHPGETIADARSARDRAAAASELESRFEVVPEDFAGLRLPNQVTQAELEQVAHTYSDIRSGRGDLTLDPTNSVKPENTPHPDQFRADMMDDVADLMETKSGRALVMSLSNNTHGVDADGKPVHHATKLMPQLFADGTPEQNQAITVPSEPGNELLRSDGTASPGSGSRVHVNPNRDLRDDDGMEARSDVALYHELVHAYDISRGTRDTRTVDPDAAAHQERELLTSGFHVGGFIDAATGTHRDEYRAVGLGPYAHEPLTENAYRAERQELGFGARGIVGDTRMGPREDYTSPITYHRK